jgi:hypothetical protein
LRIVRSAPLERAREVFDVLVPAVERRDARAQCAYCGVGRILLERRVREGPGSLLRPADLQRHARHLRIGLRGSHRRNRRIVDRHPLLISHGRQADDPIFDEFVQCLIKAILVEGECLREGIGFQYADVQIA